MKGGRREEGRAGVVAGKWWRMPFVGQARRRGGAWRNIKPFRDAHSPAGAA